MADEEDDILRGRDPLYTIPNTYKAKNDQDLPPWMTAEARDHDFKLWQHRYKYFSHVPAHKREQVFCQFYGAMSNTDTMATANKASSTKCAEMWPTLNASKFTYDATMERIIGNVNANATMPKHMTEPLWDKYKYIGGGGMPRCLERDYHKGTEQDSLHSFKIVDKHVPVPRMKPTVSSASTGFIHRADVVEQATARPSPKKEPRRSSSEAMIPMEVKYASPVYLHGSYLKAKPKQPTKPEEERSQGSAGSAAAFLAAAVKDKSRSANKR